LADTFAKYEWRPLPRIGLNLAYHGARAEQRGFNITLERSFDPAAGEVDLFPQEITRVLLNLISNCFYAATNRKAEANGGDYEPTLAVATKNLGDSVEIRIRDNGSNFFKVEKCGFGFAIVQFFDRLDIDDRQTSYGDEPEHPISKPIPNRKRQRHLVQPPLNDPRTYFSCTKRPLLRQSNLTASRIIAPSGQPNDFGWPWNAGRRTLRGA
jgi:hypothetical protein